MPTEAVWIMITVPKKEHEKEMKQIRRQNLMNNLDITGMNLLLKTLTNIIYNEQNRLNRLDNLEAEPRLEILRTRA